MLSRNQKGRLVFKYTAFEMFLGSIFAKCENEHEIEFVKEQIEGAVFSSAEDREVELLEGEE